MARNRARSSAARRERAAGPAILRSPGLRWVPVPLAALAAVIGVLVMGSFQGQAAETSAHQTGYRAGGLELSIDQMYFLSNNMNGLGPGQKNTNPNGYSMPTSEMPGIQPVGDNRLRVEVALANITTGTQWYSTTDFTLTGAGKTWQADGQGHSAMAGSAQLAPGFQATVDVYFDIPGPDSKHLTLHWSRDGTAVSIPVSANGDMGGMHM